MLQVLSDSEEDDDRHLLVNWKYGDIAVEASLSLSLSLSKSQEAAVPSLPHLSVSSSNDPSLSATQSYTKLTANCVDAGKASALRVSLSDSEASLHTQINADRGKVVCLDSDSDSDGLAAQWGLRKCVMAIGGQETVSTTLVEKSDLTPVLELKPYELKTAALGDNFDELSKKRKNHVRPVGDSNHEDLDLSDTEKQKRLEKVTVKPRRSVENIAIKQHTNNKQAAKRLEKVAPTIDKVHEEKDLARKNKAELRAAEKQRKLDQKEAAKQRRLEEQAAKRFEKEEEKKRQQEDTRMRKEIEKGQREGAKAEAATRRKAAQEKEKWDKGKFALQNTCAWIDCRVVESGMIGGHLLNRLAEKEYKFHLVSNPVEKTIIWKMKRPFAENLEISSQNQSVALESHGVGQIVDRQNGFESCTNLSQVVLEDIELPYVAVVLEAEEFSLMVSQKTLDAHVHQVQNHFPGFTISYIVNKLKWFLQKKDQSQYKLGESGWVRPNVEQALAQFTTDYVGIHSRLCLDEAEVADHVVGLTKSLAECPFKQRLTSLSVSKNGDHIVNNDPNKETIKSDIWLKALVALPRVSGACAVAIAKKYPNLRSLLNVYLDPSITVHQKEFLLQDLLKEGLLSATSNTGRRIGPACSRRVFRIFMAQNGNLKVDDVEDGADLFED